MRYKPLPAELFRFATTDRLELHTAVLYAFGAANDRMVTSLTAEDVRSHLQAVGWRDELTDEELASSLDQLVSWKLLDVGQNHTERYSTARDYERRNLQYAVTRAGEAALVGHAATVEALSATGALQSAVLEAIAEKLDALADLMSESSTDPAATDRQVYVRLQELEAHLAALAGNVKQFNGELQRLLRAENVDEDTFLQVKQSTVTYLQEYIARLDERGARIRRALGRVRSTDVERVFARAYAGAELPPHLTTAERELEWLAQASARWAGLDAWFAPTDGSGPRIADLSATGRRAIVALLQVIDRLRAARRRPSSTEADLRQLARWFAAAPDDEGLHRLWRVAFGQNPSRHAHLAHPDPDEISAGTRWRDADPVPVSRTLRESGRTEVFSRTGRVRDVASVRQERAERARAEREAATVALESLCTDGRTRLSALAELDAEPFRQLIDLVGRAVSQPVAAERRARSADGRVEIVLVQPSDGARAVMRTATGVLECPDFELTIALTGTPRLVGAVAR
jgi:uncharacterized protein (TIGR02677 family)